MGFYIYRTNGLKFTNNKITSGSSAYYSLYCYYPYQSPEISGNEIVHQTVTVLDILYAGTSSNRAKLTNNTVATIPVAQHTTV
ncbi:MAG: hypothetical protein H6551_01265 [Chitinophagales bacterium]|nr:hypothetical protein [Chitinophagales bacterium]